MRRISLSTYFGKPHSKVTGYNIPSPLSGVVGVCWLPVESHPFSLRMVSPFVNFQERERKVAFIITIFYLFSVAHLPVFPHSVNKISDIISKQQAEIQIYGSSILGKSPFPCVFSRAAWFLHSSNLNVHNKFLLFVFCHFQAGRR